MRQIGVATKPRNSVDIREEKIFTLPKVPDAWHNRIDQNSSVPEAIYHACVGIKNVWARERIIKLHVIGCSIFVCLGLLLDFDLLRWAITTLGAGLLILSEMLNTAVERIADMLAGKRFDHAAREAKDIAAGAVLCCVIASLLLGTLLIASTPKFQNACLAAANSLRQTIPPAKGSTLIRELASQQSAP